MPMQTITIHPGGNFAISGSMSSSVAVWDLESGERIRQLGSWSQGQGSINHVLVTDDGRLTVTADARGYVRIWEAQTGKWLGTWSADAPIKSLAFASGVIIAGTEGGEVLLLELVEGVTGRR